VMRLVTRLFIPCLIVAAGLLLAAPFAHAQVGTAKIDSTHFWTYKMQQPIVLPNQVVASDQFFTAGIPVSLDNLTHLVNWVIKNNSTVRDTFVHYTWWNIQNKVPVNRPVTVSNQFGTYPVTVENLEFMLVPAWKNQPGPGGFPNANHYLCYRAQGFPSPNRPYFLTDEWRTDVQIPGPMQFLCAPCMKQHNGQIFPVIDPDTHLALYPINPQSEVFYPFLLDQFIGGNFFVQQTPVEYLLVPSTKTEISTPTKKSTWGKLKMLYK
jgi:hypothetical protein